MTENLPGKRVLIVEDNPILAYDLHGLLGDTGAQIIGPALDLPTGLQLARENDLDAALLDIDLGEERVWPLARELIQHTVPFAFISAECTEDQLPDAFRGYTCIEKPARTDDIYRTLDSLIASKPS